MKINKLGFLLYFLLFILIFGFLFRPVQVIGGDYLILTPEISKLVSSYYGWCGYTNLGINCTPIVLHYLPYGILINILYTILPNSLIVERLVWWLPFAILSFISISLLFRKVFPGNDFWLLTPLIFIWNTYSLMIIGGGQVAGIGLAYAVMPLLIFLMIGFFEKITIKKALIFGLAMSIQAVFDARILYIFGVAFVLYFLFQIVFNNYKLVLRNIILVLLPFIVILLLHFYWIMPSLIIGENPLVQLGPAYSSVGALDFFSFARLENSIALLHPNWPENVFGKVGFMKPEFLVLPILALTSLLFIGKDRKLKTYILYFALLSLVAAFLAKGTNEPFGQIYSWMFENLPGFQVFRDPTKWYMLIAVSYSVLIPYSVSKIHSTMKQKLKSD